MKFIRLIFFAAFCLCIPQLLKKEFKLPPIHTDIPFNPKWEMPLSCDILTILNQPYFYFAKGNQTTVFLSEDGNYVIKLFRYKTTLFPFLQNLKNFFKTKPKKPFKAKMEKTLSAAYLGCNEGKKFTQAIYCHLNIGKEKLPTICLQIGKKKIALPLSQARFVLQRRVQGFKETILLAKNNPAEIHKLIDSFISLLLSRFNENIRNSDPNVGPNFGFLDGQAVELDFGNYERTEPNPDRQKAEFSNYLFRLETALEKWAPDEVEYLRRKRSIAYDLAK